MTEQQPAGPGRPGIARPSIPRIAPLAAEELTAEQAEMVGPALGHSAGAARNLVLVLLRHPGLFRRWMPFAGKLLDKGKLPARDREVLILRTGWRCHSEYEWGQHVIIGRAAGLTEAEIAAIGAGPDAPGLDPADRVLLRAADELHDDACMSEETWEVLSARYDHQQLIEVPMLVGAYHQASYILNSLGVPLDDGVEGFRAPAPQDD